MTVPPTTPPDNVGGGSIYGPAREVSDLFDVVEQSQGAELFKPHLSTVGDVEVLKVEDLTVGFPTEDGLVRAVRGVSYTLHERRSAGHRRRVRLRQIGVVDGGDGPAAQERPDHRQDLLPRRQRAGR